MITAKPVFTLLTRARDSLLRWMCLHKVSLQQEPGSYVHFQDTAAVVVLPRNQEDEPSQRFLLVFAGYGYCLVTNPLVRAFFRQASTKGHTSLTFS